jgi:hypothetical protein
MMTTRRKYALSVVFLLGVVWFFAWILRYPIEVIPGLNSHDAWKSGSTSLGIEARELKAFTPHEDQRPGHSLRRWVFGAQGQFRTGILTSSTFKAPDSLGLLISGHPNFKNLHLIFEDVGSGERFYVSGSLIDPGEEWVQHIFDLPDEWVEEPMRIIVVDRATDPKAWLGISSPFVAKWPHRIKSQLSLTLLLVTWHGLLFGAVILTGLSFSLYLVRSSFLPALYVLPLALTISALLGCFSFGFYLIGNIAGAAFTYTTLSVSLLLLVRGSLKHRLMNDLSNGDFLIPLGCMYIVSLLYFSIPCWQLNEANFVSSGQTHGTLQYLKIFYFAAIDHMIPSLFANAVFDGTEKETLPRVGHWKFSDRPPLQAGMVLYYRFLSSAKYFNTHYHILAIILQCLWIPSVWVLCRAAKMPGRMIGIVLVASIFSGFFFFNSLYVWPKLLAASLVVFGFSLILKSRLESRQPSAGEMVFIGSVTGIGMLGHAGVVFTVLPMFLFLLHPISFPKIRDGFVGAICFLAPVSAWMVYQQFYDPRPGGDVLIKMHLAGFKGSFTDPKPAMGTIVDAYQNKTLTQLLELKWGNIKTLGFLNEQWMLGERIGRIGQLLADPRYWYKFRVIQFTRLFPALGCFQLGILLFGFFKFIRSQSAPPLTSVSYMALLGILNIALWVLLMFGEGQSKPLLYQGSYALVPVLFAVAAASISALPKPWVVGFLTYHVLQFLVFWIFHPWKQYTLKLDETVQSIVYVPKINVVMFGLSILLSLAIALLLRMVAVHRPTEGAALSPFQAEGRRSNA